MSDPSAWFPRSYLPVPGLVSRTAVRLWCGVADAQLPYGPNTASVSRFMQRLAALPPRSWAEAAHRYSQLQGDAAFARADDALAVAIQQSARDDARRAVVGPLVRLATNVLQDLEALGPPPATDADALAESALAAVLSLIARDILPPDALGTLYQPFDAIIPRDTL